MQSHEIWAPISGWEGLYEVSTCGRVRSLDRVTVSKAGTSRLYKGRVLRIARDKDGYAQVILCHKERRVHGIIHRLMAQTFIPNPDGLPEINHKDEDKTNNEISNLEWCTDKYNVNYGTGLQRRIMAQRNHPNESKPVCQYGKDGIMIARYPSIREACRQTGVLSSTISHSCRTSQKYCRRFFWRFENQSDKIAL